ncbi:chemotaxis protein CheW [Pleionea sp. CnH1-48]|uniref:chemotaxis protein CheW n=1 Tax=Pleionea sp. CnH1-48 TaxID=2954494 RepID=UPI002097757E|nr:chemotaxis protein CheW [Pleionea sp. CnH1-48]MCO7226117.1 chemotaxis protein CheW [Pleionea sp. CnH1-48]
MIQSTSNKQQYLSFFIGEEEYCINILAVQEIRGWERAKPLPDAPNYVKGVVNLRGVVIPIMDMRIRFGVTEVEYLKTTVVIVIKVDDGGSEKVIGVVVDAVSEVYDLDESSIQPCGSIAGTIESKYLKGVATVSDKLVTVVDINKAFDFDELSSLT